MAQFQLKDGFSLGFRNTKPRHQLWLRFIFMTNNFDYFVNIEERHQQAFKNVQALEHFFQTIIQAAAHGIAAERQPFGEDLQQVFHRRTTIKTDHIQVDAVTFFQIGGGKQVVHHLLHIHAIGARDNHQTSRVFVIRFVAQVVYHRQLFIAHLSGDLLQHFCPGNLMRQRGNHHRAVFFRPYRTHTYGAASVFVNLTNFRARSNDLRFGRVIRPLHDIQQLIQRRFRLLNQSNRCFCHFTQVVRRNVRCHTNGNTGRTVEQNIWQTRRQHLRLLHGAVEVWHPVRRSLTEFAQQDFRIFRQA